MAANARVNLGLIGAGRIGKLHAENIATRIKGVRLVAVADVDRAAAEETAARFDAPVAAADYRRLLDDPAVEAVVVASATDTHAEIVQQAAAAGKHVF